MRLSFRHQKKKYAGFTFMELIMVIAIIGILSTISITSLSPIRKSANINTSADELVSAIDLAKEYSLQGRMPSGLTSICGYGFEFFPDATTYRIFYIYDNTAVTDPTYCKVQAKFQKTAVVTQTLKTGVSLSSPAIGSSTIYFSIPRADISSAIDYKITGSSLTRTISVNAAGLIQSYNK